MTGCCRKPSSLLPFLPLSLVPPSLQHIFMKYQLCAGHQIPVEHLDELDWISVNRGNWGAESRVGEWMGCRMVGSTIAGLQR